MAGNLSKNRRLRGAGPVPGRSLLRSAGPGKEKWWSNCRLPGGGSVKQVAHPIIYSETAPEYRHIGVSAGTHTEEVLKKLGYSAQEIAEFEKTGLFS